MTWGFPGEELNDRTFLDRREAGRALARRLHAYRDKGVLVLGIPRGGVPVADEVAQELHAELDVIVAHKVGAPFSAELAIGAVTANGGQYLDRDTIRELDVSHEYLAQATAKEMAEARRREERFRQHHPLQPVAGRTVIVVDDGLATGATMRAALRSVRTRQPARLVAAVPVGAAETCAALHSEADEVVCLSSPSPFYAVGLYYRHFGPVGDDEVQRILDAAGKRFRALRSAPPAGVKASSTAARDTETRA